MDKTITVKDLAKICGVSIGTIDRAINNRPGIKEETKKLILETAQKYGYKKNEQATSLALGKSRLIGVVVFNLYSEYFSQLITSIEKSVRNAGYTPIFMFSGIDPQKERDCITSLLSMNVYGIIICSCTDDFSYYLDLQDRGIPIVAVGNRLGKGIPYVGIDNFIAMYDITSAILQKGYEHIIYVSPVLEKMKTTYLGAQKERYCGFLKAISEQCGIKTTLIDKYDNYEDEILKAVNTSENNIAVICSSDNYTIAILKLLGKSLKPYGNIGIHGFDNILTLKKLCPWLSSLAYPSDEIGKSAVDMILSDSKENIIFDHETIIGESI